MGFFSSILGFAAPIVSSFLGVTPAPVAAAVPVAAPALLAAPTQLATMIEPPPATALLAKGTKGPLTPAMIREFQRSQLSGRLRKRTIVETFDPVSGVVTRSRTFAGGVAVFAADVAAARRINRQVRKLDARLPRKTVKESPLKQLTGRVIRNALERAGDAPDCPK